MKKLTEQQKEQVKTRTNLLKYNILAIDNLESFDLLDEFQTMLLIKRMNLEDEKNGIYKKEDSDFLDVLKLRLIKSITNL
jgi:hypothetical protein